MERSVPWWRRALAAALDGIRSGFGLFRRGGPRTTAEDFAPEAASQSSEEAEKIAPIELEPEDDRAVAPQTVDAMEPRIAIQEETPAAAPAGAPGTVETILEPEEENRVNPFPPQSEPADEPDALKGRDFSRANDDASEEGALAPEETLPAAEPEAPIASEPTEEPVAHEPAPPAEVASCAEAAPAEEPVEKPEPEPEETPAAEPVDAPEETPVTEPVDTPDETPEAEPADEPEALKGHDFSRAEADASKEGALAPEESLPAAEPEAPIASEPTEEPVAHEPAPPAEAANSVEAAPAEEAAEKPEPEPAPAPAETPVPAAPAPPEETAPTLPFAEKPAGRTTAEKVAAALKARGENADQSPFSVLVNQVYDGPLDLLLDLIRKQDIDIYDIPIAKITAQFLAYVDRLRSSDMDVAGEFIYTAALLIHIKSKMLLPRAPAGPDDAPEDPRRELVERLLEHERFKNAAQMLLEKQMLEAASWTNPGLREFRQDSDAEPEIAADTTDLVRVFGSILERARNRPVLNVEEDAVTVGQMIQFLTRRLNMEDKPVALDRLLSHTRSERALIAMFLALLELVRLQAILLRQDRHFSAIFIKKHTGFEALANQGMTGAHDDWR